MKNFLKYFILLVFVISISCVAFLSIKGYETDKFNDIIEEKINKVETDINLKLTKIKIKIEIKSLDLFFSTNEANLIYKDFDIPIKDIKIYLHGPSLIQSEIYIKKLSLKVENLKVKTIQDFATRIKPSNFKSFILNNVNNGDISSALDFVFTKDLKIKEYKVKGNSKNIDIKIVENYSLNNSNFNFLADNNLILINSIEANIKNIPISNGSIEIQRQKNIIINGFINSKIDFNNDTLIRMIPNYNKIELLKNNLKGAGKVLSKFNFNLSNTLEIVDYGIEIESRFKNLEIQFKNKINTLILNNKISALKLRDIIFQFNYKKNVEKNIATSGKYSLNEGNTFEDFKVEAVLGKRKSDHVIELSLNEFINLELLNYTKEEGKKANIKIILENKDKKFLIKDFAYTEGKSKILLKEIIINKEKFIESFKKININTFNKNYENNNFEIILGKKLLINGTKFDSTNIIKEVKSQKKKNSFLKKINKDIEINIKKIVNNLNSEIKNFRLLGKLEKGKFIKISSKSDFFEGKHLDISLRKIQNSKLKTLEIYSDLTRPLLADFSFFKGLNGGNLLFTTTYDDIESVSNLKISNFKVKDAPGFAKLLALADLGGVADLLSGDGISFDILEINFTKNNEILKIEELYAVGSSISILMDGYVDKSGLVSLRGTMVPARELNKLISKIPILGEILIGKEVGEGVFGVSFKMKGQANKIKTTVNPIKTLTPRFITKALEKRKKN